MRTVLSLVVAATGLLASAAHADDNTVLLRIGIGGVAANAPLLPPIERLGVLEQRPTGDDPFGRLKGAFRHRFASNMMDLYPVAGSGFHASFGTRFFKRQYIRRDQEEATHGLLYSPRYTRNPLGGVRGFRRATPGATFGYTELVRPNLMVGLEGGTLLGRAVSVMPAGRRFAGLPGTSRGDQKYRMNPVLNFTVGYAF